jgi:hypothetical protein
MSYNFREILSHKLSITLKDDKGSNCTYDVYNITVTNTVPYFINPMFELPKISTVLGKEVI